MPTISRVFRREYWAFSQHCLSVLTNLSTILSLIVPMTAVSASNFLKWVRVSLTYSFPMHTFSTPWKHQKTVRFSEVFRGYRKGALITNGLISFGRSAISEAKVASVCRSSCINLDLISLISTASVWVPLIVISTLQYRINKMLLLITQLDCKKKHVRTRQWLPNIPNCFTLDKLYTSS